MRAAQNAMQDPNTEAPVTYQQQLAASTPTANSRASLGTLLLGMLIGGAITFALTSFGSRSATLPAQPIAAQPVAQTLSEATIREAARQGAATAIAEIPSRPVQPAANAAPQSAAQAPQPQVGPAEQPATEQVFNVSSRDLNSIGSTDAPVTVVEYSDFECGYCRRFYDTTFKQIMAEYVQKGLVRVSYKHYPFLADSSMPKAIVAECAAEQGKFWQMHNALFGGQIPNAPEATIRSSGIEIAKQLGIDADIFAKCLDNPAVKERISADASEAQNLGVRGTPSFLINGKLIVGAQPFSAFKIALDAARAAKN
jgi:protein-disulfide isomerase